MVTIHAQILQLFRSLPFDERKELAHHLYHDTAKSTFFETMTDVQRAHLATAIAQADRNEGDQWPTACPLILSGPHQCPLRAHRYDPKSFVGRVGHDFI